MSDAFNQFVAILKQIERDEEATLEHLAEPSEHREGALLLSERLVNLFG